MEGRNGNVNNKMNSVAVLLLLFVQFKIMTLEGMNESRISAMDFAFMAASHDLLQIPK